MLYTPEPALEPRTPKAVSKCMYCGEALFEGEEVIHTAEGIFCDDEISDCFIEFCREAFQYSKVQMWVIE